MDDVKSMACTWVGGKGAIAFGEVAGKWYTAAQWALGSNSLVRYGSMVAASEV